MEVQSDNDFEIIPKEEEVEKLGQECTTSFECQFCTRTYRRKSTLTRHNSATHEKNKIEKLKYENENLELKIKLYLEQIKFLKRLILIQEHSLVRCRPITTKTFPKYHFQVISELWS